jgi:hypothetical protein
MFRNRIVLALLAAAAILPLVGCANRRCCGQSTTAARPVYAAQSACPTPSGPAPIIVGP